MSYGNPRTTDKYNKVKKASEKAPENEIRIRAVPRIGRYISYAATLLLEKKMDAIILKASGNAVKSACQIAEILRHRILGLHQLNLLKTIPVIDEYEPKEEGLDKVVVERKLAVLEIHLSLKEGVLDTKAAGYQVPLPKEEVQEEELKSLLEGRNRRTSSAGPRTRGGRGGRRGFRRGRFAGPRGGRRGGFRGGDREDREDRGGYGGDRGGYGGGRRGGYRGGDREDREDRGGYGGGRRGGDRGGDREDRGGYGGGRRDNRDFRDDRGHREGGPRRGGDREDRGYGGGRGGHREDRGGHRDRPRDDRRGGDKK